MANIGARPMRFFLTSIAATCGLGAVLAAGAAQTPTSERDQGLNDTTGQDRPNDPLSELDALNQLSVPGMSGTDELDGLQGEGNETDPFGDFEITAQREGVSVTVRALDKIIAETSDIEIPIGEVARFGSLEIYPRFCDQRPPEDFPETTMFVQIFDTQLTDEPDEALSDSQMDGAAMTDDTGAPESDRSDADVAPQRPATGGPTDLSAGLNQPRLEGEKIFSGWMFGSSPGLNALEHSVYDVWVIDCKTRIVDQSETPDGSSPGN